MNVFTRGQLHKAEERQSRVSDDSGLATLGQVRVLVLVRPAAL